MGNHSATQSAVIVSKPDNPGIYYVFTVDCMEHILWFHKGFRYSVVDIDRYFGMGEVIEKNVLLSENALEKVTAVKHRNKKDIWVIMHEVNNNKFRSYLDNPKFYQI